MIIQIFNFSNCAFLDFWHLWINQILEFNQKIWTCVKLFVLYKNIKWHWQSCWTKVTPLLKQLYSGIWTAVGVMSHDQLVCRWLLTGQERGPLGSNTLPAPISQSWRPLWSMSQPLPFLATILFLLINWTAKRWGQSGGPWHRMLAHDDNWHYPHRAKVIRNPHPSAASYKKRLPNNIVAGILITKLFRVFCKGQLYLI